MKKLLLIAVLISTFSSCSTDYDRNFSAIEQLAGTWSLQSKTIDNIPVSHNSKSLYFYEDNNNEDFKGMYELTSEDSSSGVFTLDLRFGDIIFTSNTDITTTYDFYINSITMILTQTEETGEVISEIWVKNSHHTP